MQKLAKPGDFCPNEDCPDFAKLQHAQQHNIHKFGKTPRGVQRYRCTTCGKTFTATRGTIFFRKRTPAHEILETLAMIAEGSRISSLSRVKGFKEDTIARWVREAAEHAQQVEEVLLGEFKVKRGQLDALWAYVGNKGEKKLCRDSPEGSIPARDPAGHGQSSARGAWHWQERDAGEYWCV